MKRFEVVWASSSVNLALDHVEDTDRHSPYLRFPLVMKRKLNKGIGHLPLADGFFFVWPKKTLCKVVVENRVLQLSPSQSRGTQRQKIETLKVVFCRRQNVQLEPPISARPDRLHDCSAWPLPKKKPKEEYLVEPVLLRFLKLFKETGLQILGPQLPLPRLFKA